MFIYNVKSLQCNFSKTTVLWTLNCLVCKLISIELGFFFVLFCFLFVFKKMWKQRAGTTKADLCNVWLEGSWGWWWLTALTGCGVCCWGFPGSSTYLLLKILPSQAEYSTAVCVLLVFTFLQKWTVETKKTFTPEQNKKRFQFFWIESSTVSISPPFRKEGLKMPQPQAFSPRTRASPVQCCVGWCPAWRGMGPEPARSADSPAGLPRSSWFWGRQ